MRFLVSIFKQISRGTTISGVTKKQLLDLGFTLPPYREQHRIVAEIETQFTRLDAVVTALKRVQANLKRYRASVLQAACTGRLVPTEAELARVEGRSYESADQLLQRILQERRAKWESQQLTAMKAEGKVPKDDRWKSKYREPAKPDASELPELPEGWMWTTVEQLAQLVTDGDHNPPKRVSNGVPHLTAKHIKRWQITFDNCTYITLDDFERTRSRFEPLAGDIIVTCVGTVGEIAIVPEDITFSADRNLAGIRLVSDGIDNKMLQYVLSSPVWQTHMRQASGSTAQPHLYLGDLRALPVPMPPGIEQHRIVAEVERRLSVIDALEAITATNLKRADRLRQAILKRAFEGNLVPQDPTDEPASALLERIRMERERPTEKPKATSRQTKASPPTGEPKTITPVQGELALGFRG
jgi:type I restriction enzyme S subunit